MKSTWLSLRDLEYLVTLAEEGHFGKAAKACHVSQPALSTQIKKIEGLLGVGLFERTHREVRITDEGRALVAQARIVLEESEKLFSTAQAMQEPLSSVFRLGAIATIGPYLMPHYLKMIKKSFPKLELVLREGLTDGLLAELKAGALDAVLAARTFNEAGFECFSLFDEPFVLAVPLGHELAKSPVVKASQLKVSEMVLLEDGHCLRDQILDACPSSKKSRAREFHVTSLETLRHFVANGLGYTLVPQLAVNEDPRLKGLIVYRKVEGKGLFREVILVSRERSSRRKEVELLARFFKKQAPYSELAVS